MNSTNPLVLLDSLLGDWASPRVRRLIHGLILLVAIIVSIWLAADGDWEKFIGALVAVFYAASNVANTPAVNLDPAGEDNEPDDDLTYEEAGGLPYAVLDDGADDDPLPYEDSAPVSGN